VNRIMIGMAAAVSLLAVGGVTVANIGEWRAAGCVMARSVKGPLHSWQIGLPVSLAKSAVGAAILWPRT